MLGKSDGKMRRGRQRMRWLDRVIKATMTLTQIWETVEDRRARRALSMGSGRVGHDLTTKQQQQAFGKVSFPIICNQYLRSCSLELQKTSLLRLPCGCPIISQSSFLQPRHHPTCSNIIHKAWFLDLLPPWRPSSGHIPASADLLPKVWWPELGTPSPR